MPTEPDNNKPVASSEFVAKTTSELNNLLQIISGSSSAMEKAKGEQETAEYVQMLRTSIDRAELLGRQLASRAGGAAEKAICNADISAFLRKKTDKLQPTCQTILVVDDEKMALTLIDRLLKGAGYNVVTAVSGFECVEIFRKEPLRYSLVLLDFSLPFMDGAETFRRLREIRNNVPVLLCTGFILQERLTQMLGQGLTGFLRKPVPPDELLAVVKTTLQNAFYSRTLTGADADGASLAG